jgi:hypothetical protein
MNVIFGTLAALGFTAALGVHIAALLGIPIQDLVPQVWALHVGIFVVFIPTIIHLRRTTEESDPLAMFRGMPVATVVTLAVLFVYAFLNFFISLPATGGATADIRDGQYILHRKGTVVREMSRTEYDAARAAQLRGFSGHWLVFYGLPAAVFLFRRPRGAA